MTDAARRYLHVLGEMEVARVRGALDRQDAIGYARALDEMWAGLSEEDRAEIERVLAEDP